MSSLTFGSGSPSAATTSYTYDMPPASCLSPPAGTTYCTQVSNGLAETTTTYYDPQNRVIETAPPNTTAQSATTSTYDLAGNVVSVTDGSGTTNYAYDAANNLTAVTYSNTQPGYSQPHAVSYQYDADGNRTQMTDGTGTTTFTYDGLERLANVTDGAGNIVTYGYDADSNQTCLSYPNSGSTTCQNASSGTGLVSYSYDALNRVTQLSDWLGNTISFSYDHDSNLILTSLPSGTATTVSDSYDNADALIDTSVTTAGSPTDLAALTRNGDENIATTTPGGGSAQTYGYDALNRVTTGSTASYGYDAASELTSETPLGSGPTTNYAYNADGQLCWLAASAGTCASPPSGATSYAYDAAGERTSSTPSGGDRTTFGWDQAQNLTCETGANPSGYSCSSQNPSVTSVYSYNGDGLRMSETPAGGSTEQFTWDNSGSAPQLLEDGSSFYLYGANVGSAPLEEISISTSVPSFLVSDTTGVRETLTSSGSMSGSMNYDTYGNRCSSCSIATPFGFSGAYTDPNGLEYLVHRYYDPVTGQFLSMDPIVTLTQAPYSYVNGDPVNLTDPLGLAPQPPKLSQEEEEAVHNRDHGLPYDQQAYNRAMKKLVQQEKLKGSRNVQKRQSNFADIGPPCPSIVYAHPYDPQFNPWQSQIPEGNPNPTSGLWLPGAQVASHLGLSGATASGLAALLNLLAGAGEIGAPAAAG